MNERVIIFVATCERQLVTFIHLQLLEECFERKEHIYFTIFENYF